MITAGYTCPCTVTSREALFQGLHKNKLNWLWNLVLWGTYVCKNLEQYPCDYDCCPLLQTLKYTAKS